MSWWTKGNNGGAKGSSARIARLDLQLQLAPPARRMEVDGGDDNDSSSPNSCVSSDGSPGNKSRMLIGACSRCMLYCMVSVKEFPTCVNCKQPYLVDLFHAAAATAEKRGQCK
ncbi:hypothetical protein QOZ80_2AG0125680 [Eleusine coracana subsp. coracana]|nr:hypothetical protein QOZ80_2AG0125680 [Eleusine coracana subsp. coracana]